MKVDVRYLEKREVNFPITEGWTPNKQFCFSKSAPFRILSPHSKRKRFLHHYQSTVTPCVLVDSILYAVTCVLCLIGLLTEVLTFVLLGVRYIRRRINWIELIFFLFMLAILVYHYVIITVYQKVSIPKLYSR